MFIIQNLKNYSFKLKGEPPNKKLRIDSKSTQQSSQSEKSVKNKPKNKKRNNKNQKKNNPDLNNNTEVAWILNYF